MNLQHEPILVENPGRFVLFPIQHQDIWEFYKNSEACFWTAEEIDLQADLVDFCPIYRSKIFLWVSDHDGEYPF